ncbi:MAG: methyltransferase domain-containing protein [Candidatus Binatia bacterium]
MTSESSTGLPARIRAWKAAYIIKGLLTWVPGLYAWSLQRSSTGGTISPRYCYSVWLRHLVMLSEHGFRVTGAVVGELGPGDSIGCGLASLLSGAQRYVGLDVVPFSAKTDVTAIFAHLVRLYTNQAPIPDHVEFPHVRPLLSSYDFPRPLIDPRGFVDRVAQIRRELGKRTTDGRLINYIAPWVCSTDIRLASMDLIFSQAVLEHAEDLQTVYRDMFAVLKPGGYASHVIDFGCHRLSPVWNGHWAYSSREWHFVRGCRDFLLNREPLSTHVRYAVNAGFEVLAVHREENRTGIEPALLMQYSSSLNPDDALTRGAMVLLRKPLHPSAGKAAEDPSSTQNLVGGQ